MKSFGKTVLLIAGLVVLPAVLAAQSLTPMRVEVPFAFMAGDHMYAPGAYVINANTDFGYMDIRESRSATSERVALTRSRVARKGVDTMAGFLQFEQLGATYALRSVCAPHAAEGVKVKPAKAELEMSKAGGGATGKIVTITQ
jgi:hypothetical protein